MQCATANAQHGKFTTADVGRRADARLVRPAGASAARFTPGDRVRVEHASTITHALPRYVRVTSGWSSACTAAMSFPDAMVAGKGKIRNGLYTVVFDGRELWGRDGDPTVKVSIDRSSRIWSRVTWRLSMTPPAAPSPPCPPFRATAGSGVPRALGSAGLRDAAQPAPRGLFTWSEWAATLGDEIKRAQAAGDPDRGETHYRHWLARARTDGGRQGRDQPRDACPLSRCVGSRRRSHAAWQPDRTYATGF